MRTPSGRADLPPWWCQDPGSSVASKEHQDGVAEQGPLTHGEFHHGIRSLDPGARAYPDACPCRRALATEQQRITTVSVAIDDRHSCCRGFQCGGKSATNSPASVSLAAAEMNSGTVVAVATSHNPYRVATDRMMPATGSWRPAHGGAGGRCLMTMIYSSPRLVRKCYLAGDGCTTAFVARGVTERRCRPVRTSRRVGTPGRCLHQDGAIRFQGSRTR